MSDQFRKPGGFAQRAAEQEMKRLAKELHDDLAQRMSVLKLDLEWLQQHPDFTSNAPIAQRLRGMRELLDNLIRTTRTLASALHPPLLDDFGLVATIDWFCSTFQKRTGIACNVRHSRAVLAPSEQVCAAIFRVLQEALSNVEHHSGATAVCIELERRNDWIFLRIDDNGKGMAEPGNRKYWGVGLLAMQERVDALDGTIHVAHTTPSGLQIEVGFPYQENTSPHPDSHP